MVDLAKYEVIRTLDAVEIRAYPRMLLARVDGYGDGGFNFLFRYITGNNRQKSKIAMTAPVVAEKIAMTAPVLADTNALAFVLPDKYDPENAPEPLDEHVKIVEIPPRKVAALRFRGGWSKKAFEEHAKVMLGVLETAGIQTIGSVFTMRYNSPFMPWFLRHNEVAVEIESE
jgi:hypothetical protein